MKSKGHFTHFTGGGIDYGYTHVIYNVMFSLGAICASFNISINDDTMSENNETFEIVIMERSLPYGVVLGDLYRAAVTIVDNDSK